MAAGIPAQVVENKDETGLASALTLLAVNGSLGTCITVDVHWRNSASQTLTAITHNGVSIIGNEIGTQLNASGGSQRSFQIAGSSLPTGAVVITMSAACPTILATARVWPGVNIVTPVIDVDTSTGVGTATTTPAVTAGDDDMIADSISIRASPTAITAGGLQTQSSSQSTAGTLHHRTSYQDGSAAGDQPGWSWTGSQNWTHKVYTLSGGTPAPTVTAVDTDNSVTNEQQSFTTTGLDISTAVATISQGGFTYTLAIDSQNGTTVVADMPVISDTGPTSAPHPGAATYRLTNADAQFDDQAITITDKPATDSVLVATPNTDPDAIVIELDLPAAAGDYVRWWIVGGTFDESDFILNDDMTYELDEGLALELDADEAELWMQAWSAGTWGDAQEVPFSAGFPVGVGVGYVGGTLIDDDQRMSTIYLDDATPVPATRHFRGMMAHSSTGSRYVCSWPVSGRVVYEGKVALRHDGAMCIAASGAPAYARAAWSLTDRGEVLATSALPQLVVDGYGMRQNGFVCMTSVIPI